ncbi:ATP synthase alpha chain [Euzebya pacifica]|jgi:F-type H+-transporting ATPase subunit alpha|uniref:ATP synthase subunit alpha n=1 Tax=Euzebya pacifica TaxID=1608957 RepID=A0A346Y1T4_9ACTN|nr:F0F1 ATP synthase subunit alpha [Euzebya pacifica]AXV08431.1 ATP synthase alpha chain [Euzebya pacifica]
MTDLFSADDISAILKSKIDAYTPTVTSEQVGRVVESGDGIARVSGLPGAMANELLDFGVDHEGRQLLGIALNLDETTIGAVVLGDSSSVEEGDPVKPTGRVLSVPVGDAYLGRVVDPLGRPIDGKGPLDPGKLDGRRGLEVQAASVVERQPVGEPLQTGIKAIDAMTPIGRGQRQLIIGDRQTGKTAVCVDTIINQRKNWESGDPKKQVKCVYVAIGQKGSTIAEVVAKLEEHGAMEYTTIVAAAASTPAPFQYLAPYTGAAIGNYWMYKGEHALAIYDDLSKQADAYRQMSLLLRRPPGREAYPGDVFYLHSRLLERAAKLSDDLGGGSMTALPIIETKGGDVSAFIPTNVISITDGQVYLETDLFFQGVRPAINVGISVSRVGGSAQTKPMKKNAGTMRVDLAQFRELEAFAQFGSELDKASQQQIDRGRRTVEILKQGQYQPQSVGQQVLSIWATGNGYLDDVPVADVQRFEDELLEYFSTRHADALESLNNGVYSDEVQASLKTGVEGFKATFVPSETAEVEENVTMEDLDTLSGS